MGYTGLCQCSTRGLEPHKKAALWSQLDPYKGDGRRVTKQQQVSDTVRKERVSIEGDGTDDVERFIASLEADRQGDEGTRPCAPTDKRPSPNPETAGTVVA